MLNRGLRPHRTAPIAPLIDFEKHLFSFLKKKYAESTQTMRMCASMVQVQRKAGPTRRRKDIVIDNDCERNINVLLHVAQYLVPAWGDTYHIPESREDRGAHIVAKGHAKKITYSHMHLFPLTHSPGCAKKGHIWARVAN